jgi:hypothetical protein
MFDLMLDLETFGVGPNSIIVQLGACYFNRETGEIGKTFCQNIDANTAEHAGLTLDSETIYWWLAQAKEAQLSILSEPRLPIAEVLQDFTDFAIDAQHVWSHATFDFVILVNTYKKVGLAFPFNHRMAKDIRTLLDLANIDTKQYKREGIHHTALDDCKHQVKYCCDCFKTLKGVKNA